MIAGGDFWIGAGQGLITSGLNHSLHRLAEGDPVKPKSFKVNGKEYIWSQDGKVLYEVIPWEGSTLNGIPVEMLTMPDVGLGKGAVIKYLRVPKGEMWYDVTKGIFLKGGKFVRKVGGYLKFGKKGQNQF